MSIRVTIWNEFVHERQNPAVAAIYPKGIHGALAEALGVHEDFVIRTATLDEPEQGVSQAVLDETDVLLWWGHRAHDAVLDETVTRVQQRVLAGMGLIVLHSGHWSKVFKRLMGTSCALCWREAGERERVWVGGESGTSYRRGHRRLHRDRAIGDVWRAVWHSDSG